MDNVYVFQDISNLPMDASSNVQQIVQIMVLESVFAMKAFMKIMEFVFLENHVHHIVVKILLGNVCVILDIFCLESYVLDVQRDKYG